MRNRFLALIVGLLAVSITAKAHAQDSGAGTEAQSIPATEQGATSQQTAQERGDSPAGANRDTEAGAQSTPARDENGTSNQRQTGEERSAPAEPTRQPSRLNNLILNSTSGSTFAPHSVTEGKAGKATVTGKITDLTGTQGLIDARVLLIKQGEEHKRAEFETKADGLYNIGELEPGTYEMTVTAPNMLSHTRKIELSSGESKSINVALESLEGESIVRVTAKRSLIHPEQIGSTTNVDHNTIYQYKSGNSVKQLIESTPGVIPDTMGNIIVRGEHNAINYQVDGVILPEAAGVLQQTEFVSPRSLQSMQVDIGGYQARDGGGPLGAIVRMKSLPVSATPSFTVGQQIGGPMSGNIYYNASGAFSQDSNSILNRIRYDSSGAFLGSLLGLSPPVQSVVHDARANINSLTKIEFLANERNLFKLTVGLNESFMQIPTSKESYNAGVRQHQHDRQDYVILSYKHRFQRFFDEANLHILNCFYYQGFTSANVFDPNPVINGGQPLISLAANARRFDYAFGTQGNIIKTWRNTHRLEAGFLTEVRPTYTKFGATYYNANPNLPGIPFGAVISPFTGTLTGPQFNGKMGDMSGMRYLQSEYLQDTWRPTKGFLKRLTVDAGVRADLYHGVFGNTHAVEQALESIPGVPAFSSAPFNTQRVTNAQASGRYGASFVVSPLTVVRASYSNLFMPPPVDTFSTPPTIYSEVNGIFNGTVRPMQATRGQLADTSIERQIGSRFMTRTNLFFKQLSNYGDSGVIGNTPIYNRQTVAGQNAYGVETRVELKRARDGFGLNGFISNTFQIALLTGSKQVTGGIYDIQTTPIEDKYPDHDRRESIAAALGWQSRHNWWILANYQFLSGLQDERDPTIYGPHPARTPWLNIFGVSCGYQVPKQMKMKYKAMPDTFDLRIENLFNNRLPTNLGSPFQGTRYLLPFRFLIGCSWHVGQQPFRLSQAARQAQATTSGNGT